MDEKQIEGLRKLAESSVSESGEVRSFEEQMTAYEAHALPSGEFFVVAAHADELGIPTADSKPLLMRQGIITKSFRDHSIPPKDIENLPEWIKTHVIAFESAERDDSVCCIVGNGCEGRPHHGRREHEVKEARARNRGNNVDSRKNASRRNTEKSNRDEQGNLREYKNKRLATAYRGTIPRANRRSLVV